MFLVVEVWKCCSHAMAACRRTSANKQTPEKDYAMCSQLVRDETRPDNPKWSDASSYKPFQVHPISSESCRYLDASVQEGISKDLNTAHTPAAFGIGR